MAKTREQLIVKWYGLVQDQAELIKNTNELQAKMNKLKAEIDKKE